MTTQQNNQNPLDDLLRRMLSTPPQPKIAHPSKKPSKPKTEKAKK